MNAKRTARASRRAIHAAPRRVKSPWIWAVLGALLGTFAVLLLLAPARWLATLVAHVSHDQVLLTDTEGSVWSGAGTLVLSGGAGSRDHTQLPGRVHWTLRPMRTGLHATLRADCCTPAQPVTLQARPRWLGIDLKLGDSHTRWPASVLVGLGTPWNTIQPKGQLELQTQALAFDLRPRQLRMSGQAELTAHDLASNLSTVQPLGTYRITFQGSDALTLTLATLSGDLLLSGSGSVVAGHLRFRGEASAREGMQAELANLLNIIGSRQGNKAIMSFG